MRRPDRRELGEREQCSGDKVLILAAVVGMFAVGGLAKVIVNKVELALGGEIVDAMREGEGDGGVEDDGDVDGDVAEERTELEGERTLAGKKLVEVLEEVDGEDEQVALEAANELVYEVEMACDKVIDDPFEYDAYSRKERDVCRMMAEQSAYSLCVEDVSAAFATLDDPGSTEDQPAFNCMDYNHSSPREACLDELRRSTKERAFYDCRDEFLGDKGVYEEYHTAQMKIFEANMRSISVLLKKFDGDHGYRPSSREMLDYIYAYNQLRGLRDFDVVLDQLDLADREEFVQIYGQEVKQTLLERGCSDEEFDLRRVLNEMMPT